MPRIDARVQPSTELARLDLHVRGVEPHLADLTPLVVEEEGLRVFADATREFAGGRATGKPTARVCPT
jgi:hypothetical protein